jgi:hypothetical protein
MSLLASSPYAMLTSYPSQHSTVARGLAARDRAVSALGPRQAPMSHPCTDEEGPIPATQSFAAMDDPSAYPIDPSYPPQDPSAYPPPQTDAYRAYANLPTTNAPPARYPAPTPPPPSAVPYPYGASGVPGAPASGGLIGNLLGGVTNGGGPLGGLLAPVGGLTGGLTGPGSPIGGLTGTVSGALNGLPGGTALSGLLGSLLGTQSAGAAAAGVQNVDAFSSSSASPPSNYIAASSEGGVQQQQQQLIAASSAQQSAMTPELQAALGTILSAVGEQLTQSLAAASPAPANTVPIDESASEMEAPMGTPPLSTLMSGSPLSSTGKALKGTTDSLLGDGNLLDSLSSPPPSDPSSSAYGAQGVNVDIGKTIKKIVPGLGNSVSSPPSSANGPPSASPPATPPSASTPAPPAEIPSSNDDGIPDFGSAPVGSSSSPYALSIGDEDQPRDPATDDRSWSSSSASADTGASQDDGMDDEEGTWDAASVSPEAETEGAHMKPSESTGYVPPQAASATSSSIPSSSSTPAPSSTSSNSSSATPTPSSLAAESIPSSSSEIPSSSSSSSIPSPSSTDSSLVMPSATSPPSVLIKVSDPAESDDLAKRDLLSSKMVRVMRKRYVEPPKEEPTEDSSAAPRPTARSARWI